MRWIILFTGIIEEIGTIESIQKGLHSAILSIKASKILVDIHIGDSIAVNGICLTVTSFTSHTFTADVMHETLSRSSLSQLTTLSHVNLERAMAANGRFGGHIVAGHVDGVGKIIGISKDDTAIWYTIQTQPSIMRYIIEKGSVCIDGISLTVAKVGSDNFSISAIPHTVQMTTLQERKVGELVNLENDLIGKYIERFLITPSVQQTEGKITEEFLTRCGY